MSQPTPFDPDAPPEVLETEPVPPAASPSGAAPGAGAPRRWGPGWLQPPADLRGRRMLAWIIAVGADALQWALLPLMVEGALSPINNLVDLLVGATMVWLLGWHLAFLPSFAMKLVPFADLVPTWTAAVWLATRKPVPGGPGGPGGPRGPGAPGAPPTSPRG